MNLNQLENISEMSPGPGQARTRRSSGPVTGPGTAGPSGGDTAATQARSLALVDDSDPHWQAATLARTPGPSRSPRLRRAELRDSVTRRTQPGPGTGSLLLPGGQSGQAHWQPGSDSESRAPGARRRVAGGLGPPPVRDSDRPGPGKVPVTSSSRRPGPGRLALRRPVNGSDPTRPVAS